MDQKLELPFPPMQNKTQKKIREIYRKFDTYFYNLTF